ncbi:MAG: hypothetical protein ACRDQB_10075 [Thermocrispum sp.]
MRPGSGIVSWLSSLSAMARAVLLAAVVGFVVLLVAWLLGPSLFAAAAEDERVVTASVSEPAPCTDANARETVTFTDGGGRQTARLSACGHDKGEQLRVALSAEPEPGVLTARSAATEAGYSNVRRSVGLLLMALACVGGGFYAYLVTRGQLRRTPVG